MSEKAPHCPKCKTLMRSVKGKFGDFFGCVNYPQCSYTTTRRWASSQYPKEFRDKDVLPGSFESNFK